jgi:NhaA family Na+:H+ antiporter
MSVLERQATTRLSRLLRPLRDFSKDSPKGAVLLLAATALAMGLANSPLAAAYDRLWHVPVGFAVGGWRLEESLLHWVNDGLMAVFFFVVGLEIKREVLEGELSTLRRAALPLVAALGGMVVPAAIYLLFNAGGDAARGWGIPMATDIAFALGVLALLGERVPIALKVFLTALAIVDDIGAILVIALFYSDELHVAYLGLGTAGLVLSVVANALGVRRPLSYFLIGLVVWFGFLESGVHATLAAVAMALTIPASPVRPAGGALLDRMSKLQSTLAEVVERERGPSRHHLPGHEQLVVLDVMEDEIERAQPPLQKLERRMAPLVSLVVLPVFALANAGVSLTRGLSDGLLDPVFLGAALGLLVGKQLGITGFSWLAVRLGLADLPTGATWRQLHGVSVLGGIGFTMSLFIGQLAFPGHPELGAAAKVGVLAASVVAGVAGLWLLRAQGGPATGRRQAARAERLPAPQPA